MTPDEFYKHGLIALTGVSSESGVDAAGFLRTAAERGHTEAQFLFGYMNEYGLRIAANPSEAEHWYRKAADGGDRLAGWALGRLYLTGNGMPRDFRKAIEALRAPAEAGDPFAEYLTGFAVEDRDYAVASEWYRKAAEQGLPQAQQKYGEYLYSGHGTALDKKKAYVWLLLSYRAGNRSVENDLRALKGELPATVVEELKTKARDMAETVRRDANAKRCTGWDGEFSVVPTSPPPEIQRYCR